MTSVVLRDLPGPKTKMDPHQEMVDIINNVWAKLQALPQASALEIGAFAVLLLFVATFFVMFGIACTSCCVGKAKKQAARVQPV